MYVCVNLYSYTYICMQARRLGRLASTGIRPISPYSGHDFVQSPSSYNGLFPQTSVRRGNS